MIPNLFKIKSGKHSYVVPLKYKINNLCGDTATGKTSLISIITELNENPGIILCILAW